VNWVEAAGVLVAGLAAGTVNTVVGSGSLITFPTLLALGLTPVTANVSNNVGLVPGGVSGSWGYRGELVGQGGRVRVLVPVVGVGAVVGAVLLLVLPPSAFQAVVPVLLAVSLVLVGLQPWLQARAKARRAAGPGPADWLPAGARRRALLAATFAAGVYGGYFGAALGVLLMGLLGAVLPDPVHRLNALKNVLALTANALAALVFALVARAQIDLAVVGLVAAGSVVGGLVGARYGRRLPPTALRVTIIAVGLLAVVRLLAA
jgi:uncharacterized protein